jgi:hypothetical protein
MRQSIDRNIARTRIDIEQIPRFIWIGIAPKRASESNVHRPEVTSDL